MGVITERYPATVTANNDDEQRGRIKVACAQLLGDEDTELPMWIEPVFDWGWFYVPDVGETIDVIIITGSDDDESYGQMSIDNLDIHWDGNRYFTDQAPENENTAPTPVHPDFIESYGKRRGFTTPNGHVFMFDDTADAQTIQLTWSKEKPEPGVAATPEASSRLEFEADGSLKITLLNKNTIHFKAEDNQLTIGIDEGAAVDISGKDADTVTILGDGGKSAVIAEALKNYIDNTVKIHVDIHAHTDSMGGTGPPTTQLTAYDDAITSTKLLFPNG